MENGKPNDHEENGSGTDASGRPNRTATSSTCQNYPTSYGKDPGLQLAPGDDGGDTDDDEREKEDAEVGIMPTLKKCKNPDNAVEDEETSIGNDGDDAEKSAATPNFLNEPARSDAKIDAAAISAAAVAGNGRALEEVKAVKLTTLPLLYPDRAASAQSEKSTYDEMTTKVDQKLRFLHPNREAPPMQRKCTAEGERTRKSSNAASSKALHFLNPCREASRATPPENNWTTSHPGAELNRSIGQQQNNSLQVDNSSRNSHSIAGGADDAQPGAFAATPGGFFSRNARFVSSLLASGNDVANGTGAKVPMTSTATAVPTRVLDEVVTNPPDLAVARAVDEEQDDLPRAAMHNPDSKEQQTRRMMQFKCKAIAVAFFCIIAILVVLAVVLTRNGDTDSSAILDLDTVQTEVPTPSPTLSPEAYIKSILPKYTVELIENDGTSPQYNAFRFMLEDSQLSDYTVTKLRQRFALATFYHATNGFEWKNNKRWLKQDIDECEWYSPKPKLDIIDRDFGSLITRIYISDSPCKDGVYQHLTQYGNDVNGTLPPEVFELLPSLVSVNLDPQGADWLCNEGHNECGYLSEYRITGSIPSEIGLCSQLEYLSLDYQRTSGPLPANLGSLSLLKYLRLYGNSRSGKIPTTVGHMKSLILLEVAGNLLNGTIPSEIGLMSNLTSLDLSNTGLTGTMPSEIWLVSTLTSIDLSNTGLTGTIPSEIGLMSSLTSLGLSHNETIPSEIGLLSSLTSLTLTTPTSTDFSGIMPTDLTGSIPSEIGLLSSLTEFYLSYTGSIPSEIGLISSLTSIGLYFTGTIPSEIGLLSSLTSLTLATPTSTDVTGTMPTDLTGSIPSEIGLLSSLTSLYLSYTGSIPSEFGLLSSLTSIVLYFTGTIPSKIGLLSSLTSINSADFTGTIPSSIPSEIGLMSSLTSLDLSHTDFTGTIPSEIGLLASLFALDLSYTNFTGTIPSEIGLMSSLTHLDLSNATLTGTIPSEIGLLSSLTEFHLVGTTLTDTIPREVFELCNLTGTKFKIDFCSSWPGQFPPPNSTHELIINVQHDDYPEETMWLFQVYSSGGCLSTSNVTGDGQWTTIAGKKFSSSEQAGDQASISQPVISKTFYRFVLSDSYEDGLESGAWVTITTGAESNAMLSDGYAGTVLWSVDSENPFTNETAVYLWVDAHGQIEVVEDGASRC